jgi:hypothetical protein
VWGFAGVAEDRWVGAGRALFACSDGARVVPSVLGPDTQGPRTTDSSLITKSNFRSELRSQSRIEWQDKCIVRLMLRK